MQQVFATDETVATTFKVSHGATVLDPTGVTPSLKKIANVRLTPDAPQPGGLASAYTFCESAKVIRPSNVITLKIFMVLHIFFPPFGCFSNPLIVTASVFVPNKGTTRANCTNTNVLFRPLVKTI
jgi:hypothetical protein